eukprot:4676957-Amphidinium_carterae.1
MDARINHDSPNAHWIVVLDAAPVHIGADFRARMSKDMPWIKLAFVEPGVTSVSQPLDRAMMRPLKAALQRQVASQLGIEILDTLDDGGGFDINGGLVANRPRLPTWVWNAITEVAERPGLAEHAWRFVHEISKEECMNAAKKSAAMGTLFRKPRRNHSAASSSGAPLPPADDVALDAEPADLDPDEDCLDLMAVDLHEDEPVPDEVIPKPAPLSQAERLVGLRLVYGKGPN